MLSHSTKGSAKHALVDKVVQATEIAHRDYPNLTIDGELQLDAAIDAGVAKSVLAAISREKIKNQKVKISIARQ